MPDDFRQLPDLANLALGGTVMYANDEFFAEAYNLITPARPVHDPTTFGYRGKVYDGWETRRRRSPGVDFAIVRLAAPAIVRGVDVDTACFRGNFPPRASVEGTCLLGYPTVPELLEAPWSTLVPKSDLDGDSANVLPVPVPDRLVTHVRLTIYPDGGVARFRVFGEVVPDPRRLGGRIDLASVLHGGRIDSCSNMFYAAPSNVLLPGRAQVMSEGWETSRRRDDGNDWLVVRLGVPGIPHDVVIDTGRFVGNAPGSARLSTVHTPGELLPRTPLLADTEHRFRLRTAIVTDLVRLDIYPDGGLSRLRLNGSVPAALHEELAARWLSLLPADQAATVDRTEFFD